MENIAMWCGIGSGITSIIAVIVLFLTRKNIVDIIDKDVILFEGNFNVKKEAIAAALNMVDHISTKGKQITLNPDYAQRAKQVYNDLMCVINNQKIAEEFSDITLNQSSYVDDVRIDNFKAMCRKDIGFKAKFKKPTKKNVQYVQQAPNPMPVNPQQVQANKKISK